MSHGSGVRLELCGVALIRSVLMCGKEDKNYLKIIVNKCFFKAFYYDKG